MDPNYYILDNEYQPVKVTKEEYYTTADIYTGVRMVNQTYTHTNSNSIELTTSFNGSPSASHNRFLVSVKRNMQFYSMRFFDSFASKEDADEYISELIELFKKHE